MNSFVRFFALSLFVALTISATTGTFNKYTTNNASGATASVYTNGFYVVINSAGWVIGDANTLTTTAQTTWATLISNTGVAGIGLVASGCVATAATTVIQGTATSGTAACPGDFVTIYTGAPGTPTTTTTAPAPVPASTVIAAGQAVKFILTGVATPAAANVIGITVNVNNAGSNTVVSAPGATAASLNTAGVQYAISTLSYAFYVQAAQQATVCFQSDDQHTANAGKCGTLVTTTKSANIFSAAITGFVAMIALIFFN